MVRGLARGKFASNFAHRAYILESSVDGQFCSIMASLGRFSMREARFDGESADMFIEASHSGAFGRTGWVR